MPVPDPLALVSGALRCPVCGDALAVGPDVVRCAAGHAFDRARQGHVSLTRGGRGAVPGDTAAMIDARERVLSGPLYGELIDAVATAAGRELGGGTLVDLACGTGQYAAAALGRGPDAAGVGLDVSTSALRRTARAHARLAAVGADLRRTLPLADGCARVVLSVFGPRPAAEIARVLEPDGVVITASPADGHLRELAGPLGLVGVDPDKPARQARTFAGFDVVTTTTVVRTVGLTRHQVIDIAAMGPTAHHVAPDELAARAQRLTQPVSVTLAVDVITRRRRPFARGT